MGQLGQIQRLLQGHFVAPVLRVQNETETTVAGINKEEKHENP